MRHELVFVAVATACVAAGVALVAAGVAFGQADRFYPSPWGADDQRGAANRITPAKVLEARNLITRGAVYELGRPYEAGMPLFGTRHFSLRIPQTYGPLGANRTMYHDEVVSAEIGQVGTQFDGLGHIGVGDLFYNGHDRADFSRGDGLTKLGIENVGALTTRGVLVDVARFKGVPMLGDRYEITRADLTGALERQRTEIHAGDVVLVHTGWGSLWLGDNARFGGSAPGIGLDAARYLVEREVVLVGSDTWATEVVPNPDPELQFPVHQLLIPRNGIYIFENLATEELARDSVYEFAFFYAPLKLKGATGSPGNPLAIR
ncbi:MAG TPA: cyclase family protein [Gammaproteobacteria bacterium]|nr:cyclase family protein [Gammaproteobacteria bacterium]